MKLSTNLISALLEIEFESLKIKLSFYESSGGLTVQVLTESTPSLEVWEHLAEIACRANQLRPIKAIQVNSLQAIGMESVALIQGLTCKPPGN